MSQLNKLWPSDVTWRHRSVSTLAQAASHYLIQYGISLREVLPHSLTREQIFPNNASNIALLKLLPQLLKFQHRVFSTKIVCGEVNVLPDISINTAPQCWIYQSEINNQLILQCKFDLYIGIFKNWQISHFNAHNKLSVYTHRYM